MEFAATAREAPADAAWPDLKMNFSASGGKLQSATFISLESALFSEVSSQWYDGITEPEHTSSISQLARFVNTHVCNRYNAACKPPDGGTPPTVSGHPATFPLADVSSDLTQPKAHRLQVLSETGIMFLQTTRAELFLTQRLNS